MSETVLFVDDEENILRAVERLFHERDFLLRQAKNAREALTILEREQVAVIVSDNQMPGMKGTELLARVSTVSPKTVKILMTAYADLDTAIRAINQSEIYRFVVKPWENDQLRGIVDESLERFRTVQALGSRDEATLLSLAQTIELKDAYTKGHCQRVGDYAVTLAARLGYSDEALREVRYGGWLHDCGKIGVPERILNLNGPLSEEDFLVVKKHPRWGAEVARQAGLARRVVNVILHHHERYDGRGYPAQLVGETIPLEARIVSVADVFDALTTDRPYRRRLPRSEAVEILAGLRGTSLDAELVDLFLELQIDGVLATPAVGGGDAG